MLDLGLETIAPLRIVIHHVVPMDFVMVARCAFANPDGEEKLVVFPHVSISTVVGEGFVMNPWINLCANVTILTGGVGRNATFPFVVLFVRSMVPVWMVSASAMTDGEKATVLVQNVQTVGIWTYPAQATDYVMMIKAASVMKDIVE